MYVVKAMYVCVYVCNTCIFLFYTVYGLYSNYILMSDLKHNKQTEKKVSLASTNIQLTNKLSFSRSFSEI